MDAAEPTTPQDTPASKADRTRRLLADTALRLFRAHGYEATTMRSIAQEAGVSSGNAYYHFAGKDALVQELYRQVQADHRRSALAALVTGASLAHNLRLALRTGIDVMAPYHSFGYTLLSTALRKDSGTSPFSHDSREPRAEAVALMRDVVQTSGRAPGGRVGEKLPELLWLAYLGVTLFWVLDRSAGQRRTTVLIDGIAPLIGRIVALTRLPVGRGLADEAVTLLERLQAAEAEKEPGA